MKKIIYGCLFIIVLSFLTSCEKNNYTFYVEVYDNQIITGENDFHNFYLKTIVERKKASITIKQTYVFHKENVSEEYYHAHADEYPATYETKVTYNGLYFKEENITEQYTRLYKYLTYEYTRSDRPEHSWFAVEGYVLTNKANYTYSDYLFDSYSSFSHKPYFDISNAIFVKYLKKEIHFSKNGEVKLQYNDHHHLFHTLEYPTQLQDKLLSFIDSLSWKKVKEEQDFINQEEYFTKNVLYINVTRALKDDNPLMISKAKEDVELVYRIDLIHGMVTMDEVFPSTNIHQLMARIDINDLFFFQVLNEMNLNVDYSEYIQPGIYKNEDGWEIRIRSDGTFDYGASELLGNQMWLENQQYYIMNDKLILTGFCTSGTDIEFHQIYCMGNNYIYNDYQRWKYAESI